MPSAIHTILFLIEQPLKIRIVFSKQGTERKINGSIYLKAPNPRYLIQGGSIDYKVYSRAKLKNSHFRKHICKQIYRIDNHGIVTDLCIFEILTLIK